MPSQHIPTELVDLFLSNLIGDDPARKAACLSWRAVAVPWAYLSLEPIFRRLSFESWADIRRFLDLRSTSFTFPKHIISTHVALNNLTLMGNGCAQTLRELMSVVTPNESLTINFTIGSAPDILLIVRESDWASITHITLSGGTHEPTIVFARLAGFTQLRSAAFQDVHFEAPKREDRTGAKPTICFPEGLEKLSLVRSSALWHFFKAHVIPNGGFANLGELHIRSKLSYEEDGVFEMVECLGKIQGIRTLKLDAIYDPNIPRLTMDMKSILYGSLRRPRRLLALTKVPGLKLLQLRLADVPADLSLDCIGMYCIYLPSTNAAVSVEIEVPGSVSLWANSDPSAHLYANLIRDTQSGQGHTTARAPLLVKGFPGTLPGGLATSGRATICGYPVVFIESQGEDTGL